MQRAPRSDKMSLEKGSAETLPTAIEKLFVLQVDCVICPTPKFHIEAPQDVLVVVGIKNIGITQLSRSILLSGDLTSHGAVALQWRWASTTDNEPPATKMRRNTMGF